jgi:hypothetical protein
MPDEAIADLRRHIAATRWPSRELVKDRSQGVDLATIQELASYWTADHDWRKCEARLNAVPQFTTEIDGEDIHFIHVKSPHADALPLIITHGWPGSVIELLEVIGPLSDPAAHGGHAGDAFDLVLPLLPGYGFSAEPAETGWDPGRISSHRELRHVLGGSMSGMRAIGFRRRIKTPDRAATGPAVLLHTKDHGHVPGAVQRAQAGKSRSSHIRVSACAAVP